MLPWILSHLSASLFLSVSFFLCFWFTCSFWSLKLWCASYVKYLDLCNYLFAFLFTSRSFLTFLVEFQPYLLVKTKLNSKRDAYICCLSEPSAPSCTPALVVTSFSFWSRCTSATCEFSVSWVPHWHSRTSVCVWASHPVLTASLYLWGSRQTDFCK